MNREAETQQQELQLRALFNERRITLGKVLLYVSKGFCFRCGLRYANDKTPNLYRIPTKVIRQRLAEFLESPATPETENIRKLAEAALLESSKSHVCGACIGILQQFDKQEDVDDIIKQIKQTGITFKDFYITISTPPSLLCRDVSMWSYVKSLPEAKVSAHAKQVDYVLDVKDVLRWFYYQTFFQEFGVSFSHLSTFKIQMNYGHDETQEEQNLLSHTGEPSQKKACTNSKGGDTSGLSLNTLRSIDIERIKKMTDCPPKSVNTYPKCVVEVEHEPFYIAGYYIKHSRELSHTKWLFDGDRIGETSIEEIVEAEIRKIVKMKSSTFVSAGREDMNVRMMGRGRVFVVELTQPFNPFVTEEDMRELERSINSSTDLMEVHSLQIVPKDFNEKLKDAEETKTKTYRCIVHTTKAITKEALQALSEMKDLVVKQKTPIRVMHRRAQCIREKTVHTMNATLINSHYFMLDLKTQAGTYVKEFVHGDLGRTLPNIGTLLGCDADILQLDVVAIDFDLPYVSPSRLAAQESA